MKGLGAVFLQNSKTVMFASRALTGSEWNYQNLEHECLATIMGMEKFQYFLYGKEFTLETDQKPLVSIYKKHMVEISPMIQRLIVWSFPHQPFNVVYRKGVEIPLADALSHVTPLPMEEDGIQLPIIAMNMVTVNIPYSSKKWIKYMKKHGKILQSKFWCTTLSQDGLVNEGCFTRVTSVLELSGWAICQGWTCYKEFQASYTFHTEMESDVTNPWRISGYWKMHAQSKGVSVLAGNQWWHLGGSGKVWNLPIFFQSYKTSWKCQWSSTICMAHPWNWFVLLEQNGLSCGRGLLQQILDSEENSK